MTQAGVAISEQRLSKDLGFSHAEFFRALPKALVGYDYAIAGELITVTLAGGKIEIRLGREQERRIAMLRLPRTQVDFRFVDLSDEQVSGFLQRFDRSFQRGGG